MYLYYCVVFFLLGLFLGSIYNIIGYCLPKRKLSIYPGFIQKDFKISFIVLIPIIGYFLLKFRYKKDISIVNIIVELMSGLLFLISFIKFGLSIQMILGITFISMLMIVIVSDYYYMIICDEIIVIFGILLLIELFYIGGINYFISSMINGIFSFLIMFLIKIIGDFLFKRESMGGGDIKLLFIFGLVLRIPLSLFSIFLGSIIALPVSLIILKSNSSHEIPFGPFLSMAAIILLFFGNSLIKLLISILR